MEKTYSFTTAVRGYHYYRRYWQPLENEKLFCTYESKNVFDRFAIKTTKENGDIVGHLPKEISRVTKYYLDRGATMHCQLSTTRYNRSPLVQGGLEIECCVVIKTPATLLHQKLTERYLQLVAEIYTKPAEDAVVGSIFKLIMTLPPTMPQAGAQRKKSTKRKEIKNRDIRDLLPLAPAPKLKITDTTNLIVID